MRVNRFRHGLATPMTTALVVRPGASPFSSPSCSPRKATVITGSRRIAFLHSKNLRISADARRCARSLPLFPACPAVQCQEI